MYTEHYLNWINKAFSLRKTISSSTKSGNCDQSSLTCPIMAWLTSLSWSMINSSIIYRCKQIFLLTKTYRITSNDSPTSTGWTKSTLPPQYIFKTRTCWKPLLWIQTLTHPRSNLTYSGSIWQKRILQTSRPTTITKKIIKDKKCLSLSYH